MLLSTHSTLQPEVIPPLGAANAFHRTEWEFLLAVLERFGMGPVFCNWVKVLYSSLMASVRTNGVTSDYFVLHRGTQQGCCLSRFYLTLQLNC